jgi:hypothetical protein
MSATPVSICSNALLMLGDNPLSSFNDDSDRARIASNLWEPVRDFVLRSHPWNCAIKRVTLSPDVAAPEFDWAYQYTLPEDYLKALSIGEHQREGEYRIEGRKLLADDNPLLLRYVFKNTNTGSYDTMLVWALTSCMRAVFAYPITQSGSMEELLTQTLRPVLRQAKAVDGHEDTPEQLGDNPIVAARFGGFNVVR